MLLAAEEGAADERPCLTMFESKEEVERTMLALKIFPDIDQVIEAEQEDPETDEEEYAPQVFPEHTAAETRYTRSLYYGALPATDRPSLPLTRLAVDQFTSSGLDALGQKLGRLDMARAADISRQACAGPNSLVLALLYLERLRRRNPDYLTTVSSADLFLVSLMVASKFLHDDGEEDEVFNDEWASSGGIDTKELNRLEVKFLAAMDWRIFVDDAEFQTTLCRLEADIAIREVTDRDGDATYSDLTVLGSGEQAAHMLSLLAQAAIKVTAVCLTTYAAGILTLLGTAAALSRTPLGPAQVSSSVRTLASAFNGLEEQEVGVHQVPDDNNNTRDELRSLSHADLVTASLLVATLTSAPLTGDHLDDEEEEEEQHRQQMNRTRALWLSENSNAPPAYAPDRSPWAELPSAPGTYSMPVYRDRPETVTNHGPALPPLLSEAWRGSDAWREERAALHQLGLQAPKPDLQYRGRCPVLRWGSTTLRWGSVAAWPLLLTPG
jgi:hypothetical protein